MRYDIADRLQPHAGKTLGREVVFSLGLSAHDIGRAVSEGALQRLRPGVYRVTPASGDTPNDRLHARVIAYLSDAQVLGDIRALDGPAAQVWWGLPIVDREPDVIDVVREHSGTTARGLTHAMGKVPRDQLTEHGGVPVVTAARAVLDTARLYSLSSALAGADAGLRSGLIKPGELKRVVATMRGLKGVAHARTCAALADGKAEGPGESVSRLEMYRHSIRPPELQVTIELPDGTVARVDFYWPELRVAGEFDGLLKYDTQTPWGTSGRDALVAEKHREDMLRALGIVVIRWIWADLRNPERIWIPRLRSAVGRAPWQL